MGISVLDKNTWYHVSSYGCHCKSISNNLQENSSDTTTVSTVLSVLMPDAGGLWFCFT